MSDRTVSDRTVGDRTVGERAGADEAGLQLRLSRLLLGCLIAAIASTIGVAVFGALTIGPRPEGGPGGLGTHPPPPPAMPGLIVSVGFFVVAWVAVIAVIARDQILRRIIIMETRLIGFADEYGEQRDTAGYLRAMRTAGVPASGVPASGAGEVRQLHRVPPPTEPGE